MTSAAWPSFTEAWYSPSAATIFARRSRSASASFQHALGHAKSIKVFIRQFVEKVDFYIVLGKATGVLGHSEFFEPIRNFHNRAPANSVIWTMTSINQSQTINPDCQRVPGLFY
jgi:hypothetical protein